MAPRLAPPPSIVPEPPPAHVTTPPLHDEVHRVPDVVVTPYPPLPAVDPMAEALATENAELRAAITRATEELATLRTTLLRELEPQLLKLALTVGEKLAGATLASKPEIAAGWVRTALDALADAGPLVVTVGSGLAEQLGAVVSQTPNLRVEVDPAAPTWGCVVRAEHARVDAGLSSRVAAVAEALGGGDET
jgi:flagellar biosynthesis/type III secretory pathway protein FliH